MARFLSVHRIFMAVFIVMLLSIGAVAWAGWRLYRAAQRSIALQGFRGALWVEVRKETKTYDIGEARFLVIDNPMGDVRVVGTALTPAAGGPSPDALPDDHHVRVENVVRRREDAPSTPHLTLSGKAAGRQAYRIVVDGHSHESVRSDLVVRVPARLAAEVITDLGDVEVHGVKGKVTLRGFAGDTEISDCPGPVTVKRSAGNVQVSGTTKAVELRADAGSLAASDATGPVHASAHAGEIILDDVAGEDVNASVGTGEVTIGLRPGRVRSVIARARIGQATVTVPAESDCLVRTDVGLGSTSDERSAQHASSDEAGLVSVGVGIGEIIVADGGE